MKLLRTLLQSAPDAALATAAAPDIATAGISLLSKMGIGTAGVLTGALNGAAIPLSGIIALALFVGSRCVANKAQAAAQAQMDSFGRALVSIQAQLTAAANAGDKTAIVTLLQGAVNTADFPPELKNDANALVTALFAERIIDRIDELDEKLARALGIEQSFETLVTVYNTAQLNEYQRNEIAEQLKENLSAEGSLFANLQGIHQYFQPQVVIPFPQLRAARGDSRAHRFTFSEGLTPVLNGKSRQQDLADLQAFLDDKRPFSWWFWHGNGGEGKSRLALELLLQNLGPWRGGFVRATPNETGTASRLFPDLATWTPSRNVLFIIDYTAGYGLQIAHAIKQIHEQLPNFNGKKVRLLLFERYHTEQMSWYRPISTAVRADPAPMYAPARKISSLDIEELVDVFCQAYTQFKIVGDIPVTKAREFFEANRDDPRQSRRNVPLYAALLALALSEGKEIENAKALDEYALTHEEAIWRDQVHVNSCDVNAAMYSTMNRGMTVDQLHALTGIQKLGIVAPDLNRLQRVVPPPEGAPYQFGAVEPDILGELFVQKRLRGEFMVGGGDIAVQGWAQALLEHHTRQVAGPEGA